MKEKIKSIIIICSILITIVGALISEVSAIGAYFALMGFFTCVATLLISLILNEKKIKYKNKVKIISIQPNNKIEELYKKISEEKKEVLEKSRKKARNATVYATAMTGICIIMYLLMMYLLDNRLDIVLYVIIPFILVIILVVKLWTNANGRIKEFKKKYKKEIVCRIIKAYDAGLKYRQSESNGMKREYKNSCFDKKSYDIIECDDYIEGNIDKDKTIRIVDINTYKQIGNKVQDVFTGIFASINFNIGLQNTIKIVKNSKLKENKRVELDNINFENYFDVYCKDKILATRILTSEVMETIVNFYNKLELKFEIILKDSNLYLRFYTWEMFEPNIFKNTIDKKQIYKHYNILKFIVEVTEKINNIVREIDV